MRQRCLLFLLALLAFSAPVLACEVDPSQAAPHQLVRNVTDCLLSDIEHYRGELEDADGEDERERLINDFFGELRQTLSPVVDFDWIALNVMGPYRRQASESQQQQFQKVFTESLVETYGRGLLSYSDQEIKIFPPEEDIEGKRRVSVVQEIRGADQTYPLMYSMGRNRQGEWKVINVIINGINLGKTFRSQFVQAAEKHQGDLDVVISQWTASKKLEQS